MNRSRKHRPSLIDLIRRIFTTQTLAEASEDAHRKGSQEWSVVLQDAADRSHRIILAGVCTLTEEEADVLQPSITDLEDTLDRLWWLRKERRHGRSSRAGLFFPRNG
jgi:hypothetical protein